MKPNLINDPEIKKEVDILQQTMLDILQRRIIWESLEQKVVGKKINETILRILAIDYVGSQLSDLRKFFEDDTKSHSIKFLTPKLLSGNKTKPEHDRLYNIWTKKYKDLTNQYYLHRQRGYQNPGWISKSELNSFIEDINLLLDLLIKELVDAGFHTPYLERKINSTYLQDIGISATDFFTQL